MCDMNKKGVPAFERSEEYQTQIFLDALDRHVILDAKLVCVNEGKGYPKVWCEATGTHVQFPRALRRYGRRFVADVIKAKRSTGAIFYRAYGGSIRDAESGKLLA
jgi:hypothetical protein